MLFSEAFGLRKVQAELDFVDIELEGDTPLYVDPFALSIRKDEWSERCTIHIRSFFQSVIDAIHNNDEATARRILTNLSEPNETRLGKSRGEACGRGVSGKQEFDLYQALVDSEAARTGVLSEIAECDLFIPGIGPDKISDITTNIIRSHLVEYTQEQCKLHSVPMQNVPAGKYWNTEIYDWVSQYAELPVWKQRKIMLVPKASVRFRLCLDSQEYYNHFMLNFLQAEHLRAGTSLVRTFKISGKRYVTKKSLKELVPFSKEELYRFTKAHPEVLELYKKMERREQDFNAQSMQPDFNEAVFCDAVIAALAEIPAGRDAADSFHSLMIGAVEFIFYPHLIYPRKETPINDGRKRIDITYTNAAKEGFFYRLHTARQVASNMVMVECKNYSKELGNPEIDQLVGRFSINRGKFGILIARSCADKVELMARCRDVAQAGNGFVIPIFDEDITSMLNAIKCRHRRSVDAALDKIFNDLIS